MTKRQRLTEAERREQIVRAALGVARKAGLQAVTARSVAKAAGLSQGLVFFHFENTEQLLAALVTELTAKGLKTGPKPEEFEELGAFLGERLSSVEQREHRVVELLVEAWVAGLQAPGTRQSVRAAAKEYRDTFVPIARKAIEAEPKRFAGVSAEALGTLVLSLVLGTAVQAAIEPAAWDEKAIRAGVLALVSGSGR